MLSDQDITSWRKTFENTHVKDKLLAHFGSFFGGGEILSLMMYFLICDTLLDSNGVEIRVEKTVFVGKTIRVANPCGLSLTTQLNPLSVETDWDCVGCWK